MANATDQQIQAFVDQRIRPRAEQIRALQLAMLDDIAAIDDVYTALTQPTPTWGDNRTDGPPHLMSPADVLAINAFLHDISDAVKNHSAYAVVLKACVRSIA